MHEGRIFETEPSIERGQNVVIRFSFIRHSQKMTGHVANESGTGISRANLSEGGRQRARRWGDRQLRERVFNKVYATASDRTKETLEEALQGADIDTPILQKSVDTRSFFALPELAEGSEAFFTDYIRLTHEERDHILGAEFAGSKLEDLTPDQQEYIMERAEEPAITWYLSFGDQRPDPETPSPVERAQAVAWKLHRLVKLSEKIRSESRVDLLSSGHKTSTEAFLQEVLKRSGHDSLAELGGSLKILDGWDFIIRTNEYGNKRIDLILRREGGENVTFEIQEALIEELARVL